MQDTAWLLRNTKLGAKRTLPKPYPPAPCKLPTGTALSLYRKIPHGIPLEGIMQVLRANRPSLFSQQTLHGAQWHLF